MVYEKMKVINIVDSALFSSLRVFMNFYESVIEHHIEVYSSNESIV